MKCLITGGAGFIGSYLCEHLLAQGHEVICVDNFITGFKKNLRHLRLNSKFHFMEFDCSKPLALREKVELIFHFASPASPPKYQQFPLETLLVNSLGTYNLVELAKQNNASFIFASTSEIYGDPQEHPQRETYWGNVNPTGERSCYDESKRLGESIVMTNVRKFGLDGRIIRIFNTYGPRMDINDGRVITNFIQEILNNKPITINGDGNQTRSFCYITDLVKGILLIGLTEDLKGEVFNLGNETEITILSLAQKVQNLTNNHGNIQYNSMPQDDPARRRPDITKIKNRLHWEPEVSLDQGLINTIEYFKTNSV